MLQEILLPAITSIISAFLAWFFARKKNREALKSMELDNEIKSAEYYQGLLDDMSARLSQAVKELMQLEDRYRDVLKTNAELVEEIKKLQETNSNLIDELRKFKQLNGKK